jgi:hypothetical protein
LRIRRLDWWIGLLLAIGSAAFALGASPTSPRAPTRPPSGSLFGISAITSFIVPSTGDVLDAEATNATTFLGAVCFLIGGRLLMPRLAEPARREAPLESRLVSGELGASSSRPRTSATPTAREPHPARDARPKADAPAHERAAVRRLAERTEPV